MEHLELTEEASIELIKNTVRLAHVAKERYLREVKDLSNDTIMPSKFIKKTEFVSSSLFPYSFPTHCKVGCRYCKTPFQPISSRSSFLV